MAASPKIALVGNPNSGKTSLFNALTGLRQKVGNFPGITVDRKAGALPLPDGRTASLIDLPGTYSLYPTADDERVASSVLCNPMDQDHPDLVVVVADATNLRRSLLLCTQVMDLGLPTILAINMADLLTREGKSLNAPLLAQHLGVPVVVLSALKGTGIDDLVRLLAQPHSPAKAPFFPIPASFDAKLTPILKKFGGATRYLAWMLLMRPQNFTWLDSDPVLVADPEHALDDPDGLINNELAVRYDRINGIVEAVEQSPISPLKHASDRLDRIFLHPIGGYIVFVLLLGLVFQSIFAWASYPMDWIDAGFGWSGAALRDLLPDGWFTDLLVDGVWAGLGGIVVFVPQIAMLFFFISLLEDSGYMSRVVFLMDRIVRPFGFSGKSVIPLIGGMACAVPSIMMARTIPNRTERLITILVTPLMSCSARIPVYVLLISMFVPEDYVLGVISLQGLVMTGMYFLGFFMALAVAWVIKTVSKHRAGGIFVTELPIYRLPRWRNTLLTMYHKSRTFVLEAGKIILLISIVLWVLKTYGPPERMAAIDAHYAAAMAQAPEGDARQALADAQAAEKLQASYAGMVGKFMEPAIRPLGFDWKIGISLLSSFAAREVFVGTMSTLYGTGDAGAEDEDGRYGGLRARMAAEVNPETGQPVYTAAVAFSLLIFYAFAMQCMSTLAVVRKETGSWKMTAFVLLYLTALAYGASFLVYQVMA